MNPGPTARLIAPLLAALALIAVGPGGAAATTQTVTMSESYAYTPGTVTLATRGDRVRWHNTANVTDHDVYSDLPGYFNSGGPGSIDPDESYRHVFDSAGRFGYLCSIHTDEGMTGTVVVPVAVRILDGGARFKIVAGSNSTTGRWRHVIQVKKPGASAFTTIATTRAASVTYTPGGHGTFAFRSAVKDATTGKRSGWSPAVSRSR